MTAVSRRSFIAAASTLPLLARPARAAEFTYKYANNLPAVHPLNQRAQQAADRIREQSGGRLDIQIFPNNQLGSDTDVLSQLRSGAVEFFTLSGLILATLVPAASINGMGFAFKGYDQVWPAMDGELGAHVRAQIAKAGLVAMPKIWDNGFRQITTATKPIVAPDDLVNFKIRVPVSPLWTAMFKALGAAPVSINGSELYSALQTKVVDGQENPLVAIQVTKIYEVQKFCSQTNHMWDGFWFLANRRAWEALPKDLQEIASRNLDAAAVEQRADIARLTLSAKADLESKGLVFNDPPTDGFRAVLKKAGFYNEWREKYGAEAWALLEKYAGGLT